ncbi:MAG: leucine-rich repeat domain-containing protein [Gammaproteobacteria bacterium]
MRRLLFFSLGPLLLAAGCNRYEVTLNDQPLHSPPQLFASYRIDDLALRDCVAQTIHDNQITAGRQLTRLVCTHAGIVDLGGLEIFGSLEIVNLADNRITTVEPLLSLPSLAQLDLSANPGLNCSAGSALTARGVVVVLPAHCLK